MDTPERAVLSNPDLLGDLAIRDYLNIGRRRKWWIILSTIAVFVATLMVALKLPNIYRSETVIMVDPQKVPDNYVSSTVSTSISDRLSTIQQQVMSPTRLQRIIEKLNLYPDLRKRMTDQEVIRVMQKATTIEVVNPGGQRLSAFRIAFHGRNPVEVAQVANQLASMFIEENLKAREQQSVGTAEFLDHELEGIKTRLEAKEDELRAIKTRYVMDLPESKQFHYEALTGLRAQLRDSTERVNQARQEKIYLQTLLMNSTPTIDLDAEGGGIATSPFAAQIQKVQSDLAGMRSRYGKDYPDVRKLEAQLQELQTKAKTEEQSPGVARMPAKPSQRRIHNPIVEAQLNKLDQEIAEQTKLQAELQDQIKFHMSKLEKVPLFEERIAGLMRDYDTLQKNYDGLLNKKLSAEMSSALESRQKGERFVILDPAPIPEQPFAPNRPFIALAGLMGGILGGIGLAILAEATDDSARNETEVARILGKPVLAVVPHILSKRDRFRKSFRAAGAVVGTVACSAAVGLLISFITKWMG